MESHQKLDSYSDIFDSPPDREMKEFLDTLRLAHTTVTVPAQLGAILATSLEHREPPPSAAIQSARWHVSSIPSRLALIAASLVVAVILIGATPEAIDILQRAFDLEPATHRMTELNLGTAVDMSSTVNGFTVRVERVYADANMVVIGYTMSGPDGREFNNFHPFDFEASSNPTLIDAKGVELLHGPIAWGAGVQDGRGGYVEVYDASTVWDGGPDLSVIWQVSAITAIEMQEQGADISSSAERTCDGEVCFLTVDGPFSFDLKIPLADSRVVQPHQELSAGDHNVILERVSTTPTNTQVDLRGAGPAARVEIVTSSATHSLLPPQVVPSSSTINDVWKYTLPESLLNEGSQWTVIVWMPNGEHDAALSASQTSLKFSIHVPTRT